MYIKFGMMYVRYAFTPARHPPGAGSGSTPVQFCPEFFPLPRAASAAGAVLGAVLAAGAGLLAWHSGCWQRRRRPAYWRLPGWEHSGSTLHALPAGEGSGSSGGGGGRARRGAGSVELPLQHLRRRLQREAVLQALREGTVVAPALVAVPPHIAGVPAAPGSLAGWEDRGSLSRRPPSTSASAAENVGASNSSGAPSASSLLEHTALAGRGGGGLGGGGSMGWGVSGGSGGGEGGTGSSGGSGGSGSGGHGREEWQLLSAWLRVLPHSLRLCQDDEGELVLLGVGGQAEVRCGSPTSFFLPPLACSSFLSSFSSCVPLL